MFADIASPMLGEQLHRLFNSAGASGANYEVAFPEALDELSDTHSAA